MFYALKKELVFLIRESFLYLGYSKKCKDLLYEIQFRHIKRLY